MRQRSSSGICKAELLTQETRVPPELRVPDFICIGRGPGFNVWREPAPGLNEMGLEGGRAGGCEAGHEDPLQTWGPGSSIGRLNLAEPMAHENP